MRTRFYRGISIVAVAALALMQTGCESVNAGLLEGTKWASAYVPDFKGISMRGCNMTIEFKADGGLIMLLRTPYSAETYAGSWRTGPGHTVFFDDISPPINGKNSSLEEITIQGDILKMPDSGETLVFTRVDPFPAKPSAAKPKAPASPTTVVEKEKAPDAEKANPYDRKGM